MKPCKKIILAAAGVPGIVAVVVGCRFIWPDMAAVQGAELSDCKVIEHAEAGMRRAPLPLNAEEEARLREWLGTLQGMRLDINSYVPILELKGKRLNINFQERCTIVCYAPSADAKTWLQVSRAARPEDAHMAAWLRSKLPSGHHTTH